MPRPGWEMKWPESQEAGSLKKMPGKACLWTPALPQAFSQRDTGLPSYEASTPVSSCAWWSQAGWEEESSHQLQLTLGDSVCSKGTKHTVPVATTSAGRGLQTPRTDLLWSQPKRSSQQAVTHGARVHHWQYQGGGDRHTAQHPCKPLPSTLGKAGLPLGWRAARRELGCWASLSMGN